MNLIENARKLRAIIELASNSLDDKTASTAANLFPRLKQSGELVVAGTRINWNGTIKKAATDLWDTVENNPDNAPTLWENIEYKDGYRFIPEIITVTTAFTKDECGWWKENLYKSLLDGNVYNPDEYPTGWKIVK